MKIVQIIYSLDIGGIEVFAGNLAGCFAKDGDESTVVMLSKGRDTSWCAVKKKEIEATGASLVDMSGHGRIGKLTALTKFIYSTRPDVVIVHHELNTLRLMPSRLLRKFPLLQIQHNTRFNGYWRHRLVGRFMVDHYVGPSDDIREILTKKIKVADFRASVIPNGVETSGFTTAKFKKPGVTILAVGRFTKQKNFIALAGIFMGILSREFACPVDIIMAGDGETMADVAAVINGNPAVDLTGPVMDLKPLYLKSDIYVSYSLHEGLSLSLLEAMASGCAVLSTATSGTKDVIKDGINGILVDIDDRNSFINELAELIDNPNKRRSLADEAALTAQDYDFSNTYDRYRELVMKMTEAENAKS